MFKKITLKKNRAVKVMRMWAMALLVRYLLLHLPVAGCKQETYSVNLLSKALRSGIQWQQ